MSTAYTQYIIEHKDNVLKAYNWLKEHNIIPSTDADINVAEHDLSKYQEEEYDAYDNYFYSGKHNKQLESDFNYAWLYHIHNNPHHWQYWVLKHDDEPEEALEMPEKYVYEMLADWWSFSFKKGDLKEIFNWYKEHRGMVLHPNTRKLVEDILDKIKEVLDSEPSR